MESILATESAPTKLYRHFDGEGALLYVGISLNAIVRLSQHKMQSHWFDKIANVTIESFETRDAALEAETRAIQEESPKYNIQKAQPSYRHNRDLDYVQRSIKASKEELDVKTIDFGIMYEPARVANILGIHPASLRHLIDTKKIGSVTLPARPGLSVHGKPFKEKLGITGWQLMDYLEHLMDSA